MICNMLYGYSLADIAVLPIKSPSSHNTVAFNLQCHHCHQQLNIPFGNTDLRIAMMSLKRSRLSASVHPDNFIP